jgi:hypothetical protein
MVGLSLIKRKKEAVWNFYNGLLGTAGQRDLTLDLEVFHRPNGDLADLEQFFWRTKFGIPSKLCRPTRLQGRMALRVDSTRWLGK